MPVSSYVGSRIVQVHDDWMLSGVSVVYPERDQARAYNTAVQLASAQPALVFHNPQRLAHAWNLQHAPVRRVRSHFGNDEITLAVDDLDDAMRGYWDAYSGKPGTAPSTVADLVDTAETVGVIYDKCTGLGMYADYALAQQAFANPDLMCRRRYKETVTAYLHENSVDPVPLQRLAARFPQNADSVLRAATGRPALTSH